MRNTFPASERSAGAVNGRRCFWSEFLPFHLGLRQRPQKWACHYLEEMDYGRELAGIKLIEQLVRVLFFVCHGLLIAEYTKETRHSVFGSEQAAKPLSS